MLAVALFDSPTHLVFKIKSFSLFIPALFAMELTTTNVQLNKSFITRQIPFTAGSQLTQHHISRLSCPC